MAADYDKFARQYKASKRLPFREYIEWYSYNELLGDVSQRSVLDLACGEGYYTRRIKQKGADKVVGVDISGKMIRLAKERGIIAEARYIKIPGSPFAEVVFVVDGAYQRLGIASFLYKMLIRLAKERGVSGFMAEVLFSNVGIMNVFRKGGLPVKAHLQSGVYHLEIPFDS